MFIRLGKWFPFLLIFIICVASFHTHVHVYMYHVRFWSKHWNILYVFNFLLKICAFYQRYQVYNKCLCFVVVFLSDICFFFYQIIHVNLIWNFFVWLNYAHLNNLFSDEVYMIIIVKHLILLLVIINYNVSVISYLFLMLL